MYRAFFYGGPADGLEADIRASVPPSELFVMPAPRSPWAYVYRRDSDITKVSGRFTLDRWISSDEVPVRGLVIQTPRGTQ